MKLNIFSMTKLKITSNMIIAKVFYQVQAMYMMLIGIWESYDIKIILICHNPEIGVLKSVNFFLILDI